MDLRVFLVEDLQTIRSLMNELFASIGGLRVVGTAGTEAEARLWLDDHVGDWDLAIVDLVLEQGSGFGVVRHAGEHRQRGKVVVFSSYASAGIREHCLRAGADAVFDKAQTEAFIRWIDGQSRGRERDASP
jgi:two-component system OmpR family response regulator